MWNLFICGMQNFHCGMWDLLPTACKVFLVATCRSSVVACGIFSCGMQDLFSCGMQDL